MEEIIDTIYRELTTNYINTPDYFISFCDDHQLLLNNITSFKNVNGLKRYLQIISKYADALFIKSRYNEAIAVIDKHQIVIDNEIIRLKANEIKDKWYYDLLFNKARSSYYLRDFKTATPLFKVLVGYDPKNEAYKQWLDYSKYRQLGKYVYIGYFICFLILVLDDIGKKTIPSFIRQSMLLAGLIFIAGTMGYEYYMKRSLRKKSTDS